VIIGEAQIELGHYSEYITNPKNSGPVASTPNYNITGGGGGGGTGVGSPPSMRGRLGPSSPTAKETLVFGLGLKLRTPSQKATSVMERSANMLTVTVSFDMAFNSFFGFVKPQRVNAI